MILTVKRIEGTGVMKQLTQNEGKSLQISILNYFHEFCERNNLKYYLYFGSLIGAIRHHGYIPWDDDIDIVMPRDYYESMIKLMNDEPQSQFGLVEFRCQREYYLPFAKIISKNTVLKERVIPKYDIGIYIDVFPLDKLPRSLVHAKVIRFENKVLTRLLQMKVYPKYNNKFTPRDIVKWIIMPVPIQTLLKIINMNAVRYSNVKNTTYVSNIVWPTYKNEILLNDWFANIEKVDFEGYRFNIPKDYDKILRSLYGDYMQLPPVENRVNKHHFDAWIKE